MAKKKHPVFIFFRTLIVSALVFALAGAGIFIGYGVAKNGWKAGSGLTAGGVREFFEPVPERVTFLILGVDGGDTRADAIMAGSFSPKTGRVYIVSIPRDTMVTMPESRLAVVRGYNSLAPTDGVMKLNEVLHHAGSEHGVVYTKLQIEELLGIRLDYYVKIGLDGFAYFVDAIGGVEFDVPQAMVYHDPLQDLHINLAPGLQLLDGKNAEGLVRFRKGYADSDISRMATQQRFLQAFAQQAFGSENIMGNLPSIISAGLQYVETDFSVADAPKYLKYVKNFSPENMTARTLPTSRKIVGGKDYQVLDEEGAREIVQEVFYETPGNQQAGKPSAGKSISVQNGGHTAGLAAKTRDVLLAAGYSVDDVSDFTGEKQPETRIIVKEDGLGGDLLPYFLAAGVEADPGLTGEYDIVIVLGTLEKLERGTAEQP